jgi:hypothetical protein
LPLERTALYSPFGDFKASSLSVARISSYETRRGLALSLASASSSSTGGPVHFTASEPADYLVYAVSIIYVVFVVSQNIVDLNLRRLIALDSAIEFGFLAVRLY